MIDFRICDGNNELFLLLVAVRVRVGLPCQLQAGNISKTNFIGLELGVPHLLHCDFLYQPAFFCFSSCRVTNSHLKPDGRRATADIPGWSQK